MSPHHTTKTMALFRRPNIPQLYQLHSIPSCQIDGICSIKISLPGKMLGCAYTHSTFRVTFSVCRMCMCVCSYDLHSPSPPPPPPPPPPRPSYVRSNVTPVCLFACTCRHIKAITSTTWLHPSSWVPSPISSSER